MQNSDDNKNFLGKNLQNFSGLGNLYDFTYHKLTRMLDQLWKWDPTHPDLLIVNNILELYIDGDVEVHWAEGYPMPYPTKSYSAYENFEDELYDELEEMGLLDED
jgi:hypothetical protein